MPSWTDSDSRFLLFFLLFSEGLVPKRSGQVQEEPAAAGEHRGGQGIRRFHAAGWDALRPGLGDLQRLHEPLQHPHHPHRLDQPHHAYCHFCTHVGAGRYGRPRVPEPITDNADQPLLMVRALAPHPSSSPPLPAHSRLFPHPYPPSGSKSEHC